MAKISLVNKILKLTDGDEVSYVDLSEVKGDKGQRGPQGPAGVSVDIEGLVDMTGYATEEYVNAKIEEVKEGELDLSNYFTKSETLSLIPEIPEYEEPDLSGYALKDHKHPEYLTEHQSLEGLASEEFVTAKIAEAQLEGSDVDLSAYALKSEIPNLDGYATENYVDEAISNINISGGGSVGAVQADWKQNDELATDHVKNRTHYTTVEPWKIEWDGNTNNIDTVVTTDDVTSELYLVSDATPSIEELKQAYVTIHMIDGDQHYSSPIAEIWDMLEQSGMIGEKFAFLQFCSVVYEDNFEYSVEEDGETLSLTFPKKGVYFAYVPEADAYVSKLEVPWQGKKLEYHFMPDELIGRHGTGDSAVVFNEYTRNIASGKYSIATGYGTKATGNYSTAEGYFNEAYGSDGAHAEGGLTLAWGWRSHSEGSSTTAIGYSSHAEGSYTLAAGDESHAEGYGSIAYGNDSHAEGVGTSSSRFKVSGVADTTTYTVHDYGFGGMEVGQIVRLDGTDEFAEIVAFDPQADTITLNKTLNEWEELVYDYVYVYSGTTAYGYGSHAEGLYTKAKGDVSHSEGDHTIASGETQHVQGKYNIEDTENKYAHIVGNGNWDVRSNAHTLDWDGNAWFAGGIILTSPNGTRWMIRVNDDGSLAVAESEV